MSATTSSGEADLLSYFHSASRRAISELDSPSVSPSTHPASAPVRTNRHLRPSIRPHSRARSDDVSGSKFAVQTIDENEASQNSVPMLAVDSALHKRTSSRHSVGTPASDGESQAKGRSETTSRKTSSSFASVRSVVREFWRRTNSVQQRHNTTPTSPTQHRPWHRRARSESGARRAQSSPILPRRKTQSAENVPRRHYHSSSDVVRMMPSSPTAPLQPPVSPNINARSFRRNIKMETPFSRKDSSEVRLCREPPSSRRSSLVRASDIFAAPFNVVRRLRKAHKTKPAPQSQQSSSPSVSDTHGFMRGHISQLRRKRTHEALRQVSQLLRLIAGEKPDVLPVEPSPIAARTMSDKSSPSLRGSRESKKLSRKPTQVLSPVSARIATQKSMELDQQGSESSSIRNLRLGPPPNATPDEKATYKIKRSPSAETEDFLKVDISIRGGTSYLPSEARRIHTPPLPGDGVNGKRRGFFFDYNAPGSLSIDKGKSKTTESTDDKPLSVGDSGKGNGRPNSNEERPNSGCTVRTSDRGTYPALRMGKKTKPVEWYDTKLAEVDTSTDEDILEKGKLVGNAVSPVFLEMRQRTAHALHEMRNRNAKEPHKEEEDARSNSTVSQEQEEEEERGEIDYNVPEHYPNSPLCPANTGYWRFVDGKLGKGKHIRTCWMHGELEA